MKANDVFPSRWLKSEDLGDKEPTVIIDRIVLEKLSDNESKPVMYFRGKEKGLVLNKTNWSMLEHVCKSEESDDWPGHSIRLAVEHVPFQGKIVPSIRVKVPNKTNSPRHVVTERDSYKMSEMRPTPNIEDAFQDEVGF